MNRNRDLELGRLQKYQFRDRSTKQHSPQLEGKMFLHKKQLKQKLRYISPQQETKTSRPRSGNTRSMICSSYQNYSHNYLSSHVNSKRKSSLNPAITKYHRQSEAKQGIYTNRSNHSSKLPKKETDRATNNLKQLLNKHLSYQKQKSKSLSKKNHSNDKQKSKQKSTTPKKTNIQPYERELRKSHKKYLQSKPFNGLPQKYDHFNFKQIAKTKIKDSEQKTKPAFDYVLKYSYRSRKGHTPSNPSKPNQDAYIISTNIHQETWAHYFGVCDGHGTLGHKVSGFIKNALPEVLKKAQNLKNQPESSLMQCFKQTATRLASDSKIDISLSGATCIGCYLNKQSIYCCNVGDSRAIVGYHNKGWFCNQLSEDHKPTLHTQAKRIRQNKGVIEPFKHPDGTFVGPMRVWLPQGNGPGLAMTRSFGDLVASSVGVNSIPQIRQYKMSKKDRIIVIASDGVWQFMQNSEVIEILSSFYEEDEIELGCDKLLYCAYNRWMENSSVIDDITFIVIFFYYE